MSNYVHLDISLPPEIVQELRIRREKEGEPKPCSHILALHYYFDRRNREYGYGPYKQTRLPEVRDTP